MAETIEKMLAAICVFNTFTLYSWFKGNADLSDSAVIDDIAEDVVKRSSRSRPTA
jgi:hypothetical protein